MEKFFSVVITGVKSGGSVEEAITRVARVLHMEVSELDGLRRNESVAVMERITEAEAAKMKDILVRVGCVVEVTDGGEEDEDNAAAFKAVQEKLTSLLESADKATGASRKIEQFNTLFGVLFLLVLAAGWYFAAWYWGFLLVFLVGMVGAYFNNSYNRSVAGEFFSVLKPALIEIVGKEGAAGLAAIAALRKESVFPADRKLVETSEAQSRLKEFLEETKRNRADLFREYLELEKLLKTNSSLADDKKVASTAELERMQREAGELEEEPEAIGRKESDPGNTDTGETETGVDAVAVGESGFSYTPSGSMYKMCMLKPDQNDIIVPPIDAGNLRYLKPASKRILNGYDIGGVTVAFTKTHFIMALAQSYCWRIGYDCVRSYRYAARSSGEKLSSGREHELDFAIGLEHTYTGTTSRQTSAFGFNITWWKIPGMAEFCVPQIKEAMKTAGFPTCPACGSMNLRIGTQNVVTGLVSSEEIPSGSAVCMDCGIEMVYALSAGGWMAAKDEDMCRLAPPLAEDRGEMLLQVTEILNRAENMINAVDVARERFVNQLEANREEMKKTNPGMTFGNMKYVTMGNRQRQAYLAARRLKNTIPLMEYAQGVGALIFNFVKALEQIQERLQEEVASGAIAADEVKTLQHRSIAHLSAINRMSEDLGNLN